MKEVRKELKVSAIENGTVIDHIPTKSVVQVFKILGLKNGENEVLMGTNLNSKKYGKKGIIKIRDKFLKPIEANKIALVASTATIIEIRNYEVVNKYDVKVPQTVETIIKCVNPNCITNHETIASKFDVSVDESEDIKLWCKYCDKYTREENFEFI